MPPHEAEAARAATRAAVALGRALRAAGMPASVDRELLFCRALAEVDPREREQVRWAARASFVGAPGQVPAFERLFARFWEGAELTRATVRAEQGETDPRAPGPQQGGESLPHFNRELRSGHPIGGHAQRAAREIPSAPGEQPGGGPRRGVLAAYSPEDTISESEPLAYRDDELSAVRRLAAELRTVAPQRRSRRARPSRRAGRLDLRRTLRRALETDGEALRLRYSSPSQRPRRLVLICDVSGSMDRYSRALLGSLHAAVGAGIRAEAFVYATRLTRVTGQLSDRDVAAALARARDVVPDWSGGTRIGHALCEFNDRHAAVGLARGAVVIIVSDGWDRGDPALLGGELERLRLQCRRLVWVNPRPALLADQPLAVGMRAALPHVDDFVPGHDPRASGDLVRLIAALGSGRPARPQRAGEVGLPQ